MGEATAVFVITSRSATSNPGRARHAPPRIMPSLNKQLRLNATRVETRRYDESFLTAALKWKLMHRSKFAVGAEEAFVKSNCFNNIIVDLPKNALRSECAEDRRHGELYLVLSSSCLYPCARVMRNAVVWIVSADPNQSLQRANAFGL